ncbi:hypothetical protein BWQ92_21515 [Arthrobacter sp. QXT-31]|nr:hypothetical protein BWQ92_21515 [Arthrobacter sp. QXT-31]
MADLFFYLGILLAVGVVAVLGVALRQLVREKKSMSRGHYSLLIALCVADIASFFMYAWLQ